MKNILVKYYSYTSTEIDTFFKRPNVSSALERNYKGFKDGLVSCTIDATANCMDMMYEE